MKRVTTVYFFCAIFSILSLSTSINLFGTLKFVSRTSNIVLDQQPGTRVGLRKVSQITGFSQDSIIKEYGNNSPTSWTESYTAGVQIGYGRRHQPSNMVYNNSNAFTAIVSLAIHNSNTVAQLPRQIINDSSTLIKWTSFARTDSNLLVYLSRLEKNNSNALLSGINLNQSTLTAIKNDSNALIGLLPLTRANSSVIIKLNRLIKQNSSAIVAFKNAQGTLIRTTSNAIVKFGRNTDIAIQNSNTTVYFKNNFVQIISNHSRFQATTTIAHPAYYQNGITVDAGKTLSIANPIHINGRFNLSGTGILSLMSDFTLNSDCYLTNGGIIKGNGFTFAFTSSLAVPDNKTITISGNTIIEGYDNVLGFGARSQLILSSNTTLTIKNTILRNTRNSAAAPLFQPAGPTSRLSFNNVIFELIGDIAFLQGQLFFYNEISITGTSQVSYQTPTKGYIMPQSLVTFYPGSSLFYAPSSTNKDLLQLTDKSSVLYFNGSNLLFTDTGMRLTKGRVWFDNKVTLSTTKPQRSTITNGLNFGNSSAGSTSDVDVFVFAGARVQLSGTLFYNNVN